MPVLLVVILSESGEGSRSEERPAGQSAKPQRTPKDWPGTINVAENKVVS
jgi:hypothetical protein